MHLLFLITPVRLRERSRGYLTVCVVATLSVCIAAAVCCCRSAAAREPHRP
ncbi:hypothetical protein [Methanimicrococcus blatticola]|uniref:hypothetical protein n=1 Tax=Methanimicrococcus blatticola TaxID=91560 RepID=UPI00141506C1|nr:hypothetical protein [Methanimicrococcus blatticola]MBZ3934919.1 hypothetical protein [Methanimicrococcus blatticola]MCC2508982.1 hypothetical protein [Methanimicrococcus blatticola]